MNRGLLRSTAAASVLTALGSRARAASSGRDLRPTTRVCPSCGTACGLAVARRDGTVIAVPPDAPGAVGALCPKAFLVPRALEAPDPLRARDARGEGATTIAGVVLVTRPGAGPRVAARLASAPGLTLAGGDGDARVGAVWEARDARALEALGERVLAGDPDLVGVHPTFVGEAGE